MTEENRRSVLHDILKRERENKKLLKEKSPTPSKSVSTGKSQNDEKSSPSQSEGSKAKTSTTYYDDALTDVILDLRFYFLREGDFTGQFKALYIELASEMNKYGINARKYLDYIRESFDRYKNTHKMMPLDPMNMKAYKYVETSFRELLKMMQLKFKK
ncbi:MAG: hypothetical protein CK427_11385 [Leptospira sp.]|nr:MAG: hypothetical protein CK427_11385 [Leptospira sp.]